MQLERAEFYLATQLFFNLVSICGRYRSTLISEGTAKTISDHHDNKNTQDNENTSHFALLPRLSYEHLPP